MGSKMEPKRGNTIEEIWMNLGTCLDAFVGGMSDVLCARIEPRGGQKRRLKRRERKTNNLHNK
jgi:hypothetical protein